MASYYRLAYYRLAHYVGHKPTALGLRVPCSISDGQISNLNNIVSERLVQVWVARNEKAASYNRWGQNDIGITLQSYSLEKEAIYYHESGAHRLNERSQT